MSIYNKLFRYSSGMFYHKSKTKGLLWIIRLEQCGGIQETFKAKMLHISYPFI